MTIRFIFATILLALAFGAFDSHALAASKVTLVRTPNGGIQPQAAVDASGTVHLIYFKGTPGAGDVFYVRRGAKDSNWSSPIPVNSEPGSVVAAGTIRGAQIAIGKGNRVHIAWNGSNAATHEKGKNPMLYTRLNDSGTAFEPQRNVIHEAYGLDGGGTVAADNAGHVYVAWHGNPAHNGEANRKVYVARSTDEGMTFSAEAPATSEPTGACGCCGMKAVADGKGAVYMLYRSAREEVNRDMYLLASNDQGKSFEAARVDRWEIAKCPMSSESFAVTPNGVIAAWETDGQVFFTPIDGKTLRPARPIAAPGPSGRRKHPALAVNDKGETLLVWTEGTGWQRGGALAWQVFDKTGKPTAEKGRTDGVPVWGLPTAFTGADGTFMIVY